MHVGQRYVSFIEKCPFQSVQNKEVPLYSIKTTKECITNTVKPLGPNTTVTVLIRKVFLS